MHIALLQSSSLGLKNNNIENYVKECVENKASIILIPEYSLNSFFKEMELMPISMIKRQSDYYVVYLKKIASKYSITIIAPLVLIKNRKCYKYIVRFSPKSVSYYKQQILMPYSHWNEEAFFANEKGSIRSPQIFVVNGIRFSVIGGFELHFDKIFLFLQEKKVNVLLLPTISTFESDSRWERLVKVRAFLNSMYIIRANRVGSYDKGDVKWRFYGDSLLADPFGEIVDRLNDKEELAIFNIDKNILKKANTLWKFRSIIKNR